MNAEARRREVTALVEAHYAVLYRYAFRLSGSSADAEDLTQQAFLTAHEKLDQLRLAENAKAWLFAIVRNAFLKTRRGPAGNGAVSLHNIAEPPQAFDESPDLTGEELTQLLAELPDDFRIPLVLYYFEDMSYRDIASALELPIGTVMSRLSWGKRICGNGYRKQSLRSEILVFYGRPHRARTTRCRSPRLGRPVAAGIGGRQQRPCV